MQLWFGRRYFGIQAGKCECGTVAEFKRQHTRVIDHDRAGIFTYVRHQLEFHARPVGAKL